MKGQRVDKPVARTVDAAQALTNGNFPRRSRGRATGSTASGAKTSTTNQKPEKSRNDRADKETSLRDIKTGEKPDIENPKGRNIWTSRRVKIFKPERKT